MSEQNSPEIMMSRADIVLMMQTVENQFSELAPRISSIGAEFDSAVLSRLPSEVVCIAWSDITGDCIDTGFIMNDPDHDGIDISVDNCKDVANADQSNIDNDLKGDACDDDIDNDAIPNAQDAYPYESNHDDDGLVATWDPDDNNPDFDGDQFNDGDPSELIDKNGDGILDLYQSRIDTDSDGLSAETGDTDENDPCVPNAESEACIVSTSTIPTESTPDTTTENTTTDTTNENVVGQPPKDQDKDSNTEVLVGAGAALLTVVGIAAIVGLLRRRRHQTPKPARVYGASTVKLPAIPKHRGTQAGPSALTRSNTPKTY